LNWWDFSGEKRPSRVRADVTVNLSVRNEIKAEWENLRKHDVCFLVTVRPTASIGKIHPTEWKCADIIFNHYMWLYLRLDPLLRKSHQFLKCIFEALMKCRKYALFIVHRDYSILDLVGKINSKYKIMFKTKFSGLHVLNTVKLCYYLGVWRYSEDPCYWQSTVFRKFHENYFFNVKVFVYTKLRQKYDVFRFKCKPYLISVFKIVPYFLLLQQLLAFWWLLSKSLITCKFMLPTQSGWLHAVVWTKLFMKEKQIQ
jgi:hypothetical protein